MRHSKALVSICMAALLGMTGCASGAQAPAETTAGTASEKRILMENAYEGSVIRDAETLGDVCSESDRISLVEITETNEIVRNGNAIWTECQYHVRQDYKNEGDHNALPFLVRGGDVLLADFAAEKPYGFDFSRFSPEDMETGYIRSTPNELMPESGQTFLVFLKYQPPVDVYAGYFDGCSLYRVEGDTVYMSLNDRSALLSKDLTEHCGAQTEGDLVKIPLDAFVSYLEQSQKQ